MRIWARLLLAVFMIALLAFVGVQLLNMVTRITGSIRMVGNADLSVEEGIVEATPAPTVFELTDEDYDAIQGTREY